MRLGCWSPLPPRAGQSRLDAAGSPAARVQVRRHNRRAVITAMLVLAALLSASTWLGCNEGYAPPPPPTPPPADPTQCTNGIIVEDPLKHPELVKDCETLLGLRDLLGGGKLFWIEDTPIQRWNGITVDSTRLPLRVTELAPDGGPFTLMGRVPPELGQLTGLRVLNLEGEYMRGGIPAELGSLTQLEELILADNNLTARIPPLLGRLTRLRRLDLHDNRLTGAIPPELGSLTNLEFLDLSRNRIKGKSLESWATSSG